MEFCANCGKPVDQGATFCAFCGAKVSEGAGRQPVAAPASVPIEEDKQAGYGAMAILAYTGLLFLVPMLAGKESPFARFHANQGLVLLLAGVAVSIVSGLLGLILGLIWGGLTVLVTIVSGAASIALTVFSILGMVNCCKGRMKPLPLIGGIQILK